MCYDIWWVRTATALWYVVGLAINCAACQANPTAQLDRSIQRRTPVVAVFEAAKDSVVNISSSQIVEIRSPMGIDRFLEDIFDLPRRRRQLKRISVGSGFVLHPAGYIVTNAHVVARTAQQKVIFASKREFDAQVVAVDHERDLAVLKIDTPEPVIPLQLGHSADLMVGETAIAIGNPLGYQHTVTSGVISALDRTLEIDDDLSFRGLIQTDASINPGNSGGPLLNVLGQLIGINTAIRGDAQNIGFAIPVDHLRSVLPLLLDVERRYQIFSGLRITGSDPCRVEHVASGSPADSAGLAAGDVIKIVDGQSIRTGIDFHIAMIGKRPGDAVRLDLRRTGGTISTTLVLARRPQPDGAKLLWQRIGIEAKPVNAKMARALGMPGLTGLMVTGLDPDGPAHRIRFRRGDILISLGRHQITSLPDVGELLENVRSGQAVRMTALRVSGLSVFRVAADIQAR